MADTTSQPGLMSRLTARIVGMAARRPRLAVWTVLILACAAAGVTVSDLHLRTGREALVDPAADFSQTWTQYREDFSSFGDLVVVVRSSGANRPLIIDGLDRIAERLRQEPEYFRDVLHRIDQRRMLSKGLQQLDVTELQRVSRRIHSFAPVLQDGHWDQIRTENLSYRLRRDLQTAQQQGRPRNRLLRSAKRFADSLDDYLADTLKDPDHRHTAATFPSPWVPMVSAGINPNGEDTGVAYMLSNEHDMGWLHVRIVPHEQDLDPTAASIRRLREICADVEQGWAESNSGMQVAVTGIPALEHDELSQAGHDMLYAAALALFAVAALLSFGFRSVRHPMLVLLTLVVAVTCTFGVATLAVGHLNILSLCFAAILIGLGVDFGIHFLSRYLHTRQLTEDIVESLQQAGLDVGSGILTSAVTTALAFGSAALTGFPGLAELGLIAGSGILICAACTFLFLPALIALSDAGSSIEQLPQPMAGRMFRRIVAGVPLIVLGVSVAGTVGLGSRAVAWNDGRLQLLVGYDSNLMHLQDPNQPSVQAQQHLWHSEDESLLYAVAVANSMEEADTLAGQLEELDSVHHVLELGSLLSEKPQAEQYQLIQTLRGQISNLTPTEPRFSPSRARVVGAELDRLYQLLADSPDPLAVAPARTLDRFLSRLSGLRDNPARQDAILTSYQHLLASSLMHEFGRVGRSSSLNPLTPDDLPQEWVNRLYRNSDGQEQYLLAIYPQHDLWEDRHLSAFVQDVRGIVPTVTGIPVQNYEAAAQLRSSWKTIAIYSLTVISLFLLIDFLRPGQKALTLLTPMIVAGLIGYSMQQRTGELNLHLLVGIYLGMVAFIALVVDFRNLRDTLIALLPPVVGAVLMAGTLNLLQISMNPLNLVVLPLVLGIGVDDGIHMVHDYRRQVASGSRDYSPSPESLSGVLLTSITSIVGFGSLVTASHQGLVSVGLVMAIGVAGCMLVALIPLPALLTLVARHQPPLMEPVVKRKPRPKKSAEAPVEGGTDDEDEERPMTRREKRRQARAA